MCYDNNEKREKTNKRRNRTNKLRKNENADKKKETYKYLGILEADPIKEIEMKEKLRKEYLRWNRKIFETKLDSKNLMKGINTWAVLLLSYHS